MELMNQVFPILVRPGGICVPLCDAALLTPVSEHRLTEALEGTCLAGSSDLIDCKSDKMTSVHLYIYFVLTDKMTSVHFALRHTSILVTLLNPVLCPACLLSD